MYILIPSPPFQPATQLPPPPTATGLFFCLNEANLFLNFERLGEPRHTLKKLEVVANKKYLGRHKNSYFYAFKDSLNVE